MEAIRYIITKYRDGILSFTLDSKTGKMESVVFTPSDKNTEDANIGDIFVAKVNNVARQINAAFIDYALGKRGYLPIDMEYAPVITNRPYDGRILAGDEILVQLEKEAVRSKEPVFTTNLSLAGKYSVVSCGNTYKGVSRKCSKAEKEQLRAAIPEEIDYGVVIRTNAALLLPALETTDDMKAEALQPVRAEISYLSGKLSTLLHDGIHRTCYSRIWHAAPSYLTNMRDGGVIYQQILTDNPQIYDEVREFATLYLPEQLASISLYQDDAYPLQKLYRVETQLDELLAKKVWLKSGAYLVIEKTEAMYVIDVNSGKNISKKSNAEYILSLIHI